VSLEQIRAWLADGPPVVDPALVERALEDHLRTADLLSDVDARREELRWALDYRRGRLRDLRLGDRAHRINREVRYAAVSVAGVVVVLVHAVS
jgi:hypothetical protein